MQVKKNTMKSNYLSESETLTASEIKTIKTFKDKNTLKCCVFNQIAFLLIHLVLN